MVLSSFDFAHCIFAYSYYAISQRIKSNLKEKESLNKRLKTTIIVLLLLNLVAPAIYCICLSPNYDLGLEISGALIIVLRAITCIYLTIAIKDIKQTLHQKCENVFDKMSATIHLVSFYIFCLSNVPVLISIIITSEDKVSAYIWCYSLDQISSFIS